MEHLIRLEKHIRTEQMLRSLGIKQLLKTAFHNPDWIIVYYHQTAYSTASKVAPYIKFRDTYHPLFDKHHVDVVLQGHEHNYQRSYPLKYNVKNSTNPIITDHAHNNYTNPQGRIFTVVGNGRCLSVSIERTCSLYSYPVYRTWFSRYNYDK